MKERKSVHHACGYSLTSEVLHVLWDQIVVNYRDGNAIVFQCPKCGKPLRLWWERPEGYMPGEGEPPWSGEVVMR